MSYQRTRFELVRQDAFHLTSWLARAAIARGFPIERFSKDGRHSFLYEEDVLPAAASAAAHGDGAAPEGQLTAQQRKNAKKNARKKALKEEARAKQQQEAEGPAAAAVSAASTGTRQHDEQDANGSSDVVSTLTTRVDEGDSLEIPEGAYTFEPPSLVALARFLGEKGVPVPMEVLLLVARSINLRRQTAERFLATTCAPVYEHGFSIATLREVGTLLYERRAARSNPEAARSQDGEEMSFAEFVTRQERLLGWDDIKLPMHSNASAYKAFFSIPLSRDEAILSGLAFMVDLQDAREWLRDLWTRYGSGEIDLVTAAVVTNSTLELLRRPHAELIRLTSDEFDSPGASVSAALLGYLRDAERGCTSSDPIPAYSALQDDIDKDLQNRYEALFMPTQTILESLATMARSKYDVVRFNPATGAYDDSLVFSELATSTRWEQQRLLILDSYAAYSVLFTSFEHQSAETAKTYFAQDQMALSLWETFKARKCNLFATFCAQVFIDINFTLGAGTHHACDELRESARQMTATLQARAQTEPKGPLQIWESESLVQYLLNELGTETGEEDKITRLHGDLFKAGRKPAHNRSLIQRNPVMCGMSLYRLRILYQNISLKIANSFRTIMSASHLYQASKRLTPSSTAKGLSWPDLDLLLRHHGLQQIFGTTVYPRTAEEAHTRLMTMLGAPDALLQTFRREDTGAGLQTTEPVEIAAIAPTDTLLYDPTKVAKLFQAKFFEHKTSESFCAELEGILVFRMHRGNRAGLIGRRLRPGEIGRELQNAVSQEYPLLRVDYVATHLRCFRALKAVHGAVDADIWARHRWRSVSEHELAEITTVGMVLRDAARTELIAQRERDEAARKNGEGSASASHQAGSVDDHASERTSCDKVNDTSAVKAGGVAPCSPLLVKAAETLTSFLRDSREGDVETKMLASKSRSHRALALRTGKLSM